jgi:hypothetical protein
VSIYEKITTAYPELVNADFFSLGIMLQDDSDGQGVFIAEWGYSKPLPTGLKVGK